MLASTGPVLVFPAFEQAALAGPPQSGVDLLPDRLTREAESPWNRPRSPRYVSRNAASRPAGVREDLVLDVLFGLPEAVRGAAQRLHEIKQRTLTMVPQSLPHFFR